MRSRRRHELFLVAILNRRQTGGGGGAPVVFPFFLFLSVAVGHRRAEDVNNYGARGRNYYGKLGSPARRPNTALSDVVSTGEKSPRAQQDMLQAPARNFHPKAPSAWRRVGLAPPTGYAEEEEVKGSHPGATTRAHDERTLLRFRDCGLQSPIVAF